MDEVRLSSITINGPGMWNILHSSALECSSPDCQLWTSILRLISSRISCARCQSHLSQFLRDNPLDNYHDMYNSKGRFLGYFIWTVALHNSVNESLGKKTVDYSRAYSYYVQESPGSECATCEDTIISAIHK
jgi:hypothetical protein